MKLFKKCLLSLCIICTVVPFFGMTKQKEELFQMSFQQDYFAYKYNKTLRVEKYDKSREYTFEFKYNIKKVLISDYLLLICLENHILCVYDLRKKGSNVDPLLFVKCDCSPVQAIHNDVFLGLHLKNNEFYIFDLEKDKVILYKDRLETPPIDFIVRKTHFLEQWFFGGQSEYNIHLVFEKEEEEDERESKECVITILDPEEVAPGEGYYARRAVKKDDNK